MNLDNIIRGHIHNTDGYKPSHFLMYPDLTQMYGYVESRGGKFNDLVMFGFQIFRNAYLKRPITREEIEFAAEFFPQYGVPFNRSGWEHILEQHSGFLPIRIYAVPEGTVVPVKNVLALVYATDPKCAWLVPYIETMLLRAIWYGTTVATGSREIKKVIARHLKETCDKADFGGLLYMLHDFGARGVSSLESAGIAGAAHLVNFSGSDTITGILYARQYYGEKLAAKTVPAAEHSTIITWKKQREVEAYRNIMEKFKGYPIISVVSDTYDVFNATDNLWGEVLHDAVIASGSTLVIRPDSGDPALVVTAIARILEKRFGVKVNSKGFKVLQHVKILQGDGINRLSIDRILNTLKSAGFAASNMVFGMGGELLQSAMRDDQKFAFKICAATEKGELFGVSKDPITDPGKKSKEGIPVLERDEKGNLHTVMYFSEYEAMKALEYGVMRLVFDGGFSFNSQSFKDVRSRARIEEELNYEEKAA